MPLERGKTTIGIFLLSAGITFGAGLVFFLGSELLKERENDLYDFFKIFGSFLAGGFTFKLIDKHYED